MRRTALLPLTLLAACSKPAEKAEKLSAADVAAEARKLRLQPGQWETTTLITDMNIPGLSADAAKAATGTRTVTSNCVTPAQAAQPSAEFLSGAKDGNCTYRRFSMANARINAAMTCEPAAAPGAIAMTLNGGYSPTAFDMGMAMKTDLPGDLAMTMKARVSGKRVGECAPQTETNL